MNARGQTAWLLVLIYVGLLATATAGLIRHLVSARPKELPTQESPFTAKGVSPGIKPEARVVLPSLRDGAGNTTEVAGPDSADDSLEVRWAAAATELPWAVVAGLSDAQRGELRLLLVDRAFAREQAAGRAAARYRFPVDVFMEDAFRRRPELGLTADQEQELQRLRDQYRPLLERLLKENWAQEDALANHLRGLASTLSPQRGGSREAWEKIHDPLDTELRALRQQAVEMKKPLEDDYTEALRNLLTEEQNQAVRDQGRDFLHQSFSELYGRSYGRYAW